MSQMTCGPCHRFLRYRIVCMPSDSPDWLSNAAEAADIADCSEPFRAAFDFGEEFTGDMTGMRTGGMKIDGDTVCHRLLESREVGDKRLESVLAEMLAELFEVGRLVFPPPLEAGHDETE